MITVWVGESNLWQSDLGWAGPPIPSMVPGPNDRAIIDEAGAAPIIYDYAAVAGEVLIYAAYEAGWGLGMSAGGTLNVTNSIYLRADHYVDGNVAGVRSSFLIGWRAEVTTANLYNNGDLTVVGSLDVASFRNQNKGLATFKDGSVLTFGAITNLGTFLIEDTAAWSIGGNFINDGVYRNGIASLESRAAITTMQSGVNFSNLDTAVFRTLVLESGSVLASDYGSVITADAIEVRAGGVFSLAGTFVNLAGTITNHGEFTNAYTGRAANAVLRGNIENFGVLKSNMSIEGDVDNSGEAILRGRISGNLTSAQTTATPAIVRIDNLASATSTTTNLIVDKNVQFTDTIVYLDLGQPGVNASDAIRVGSGQSIWSFTATSSTFRLSPFGGAVFDAGMSFRLVQVLGTITMQNSTFEVLNQHAGFSYAVGVMDGQYAGQEDLVFMPLNSGASGGYARLNMSAGTEAAVAILNDDGPGGSVKGGIFSSADYYWLWNVNAIDGTGLDDVFVVIEGSGNELRGFTLAGRGGDDTLVGGRGNDILNGGTGTDDMNGGAGNDIYYVDRATDIVTDSSGIDEVRSTVNYRLGADIENLTLLGTANRNATGNALANVINGNSGDNRITGGGGADTMSGNGGNDTFVFKKLTDSTPGTGRDIILDFSSGDRIDLSAIDANLTVPGKQAFVLDTDGSFSIGEIRVVQSGDRLLVSVNADADAAAEMIFVVRGVATLTAADFIL